MTLKDVEDLSLKFSIEGDFKLNGELDVATWQKKLIEASTQKASLNGSANVTHTPGRRRMLFVIAIDCYDSNSNITEKLQKTIQNVMKAAGLSIGLAKVGFILVVGIWTLLVIDEEKAIKKERQVRRKGKQEENEFKFWANF